MPKPQEPYHIKTPLLIFLAEDDVDDQEFLREAFHAIDPTIQLVSFSSGLKFLRHLNELEEIKLPHLIILDYNIPELNGAEILEELKTEVRFAPIPKIVWSTSDSQLFRQNCLKGGASAYNVKPSSIDGIQKIAREMLTHC